MNSNIKKIIHTSTSEVYGSPKYIPIDEKHLVSAQSPYAASKVAADQIALSYNKSFNSPVTILRPFNTFGPRQSLRAIIPTIITQILNKKVLKLGSLYPTRDLTYIDDTTDAFLCALNKKKDVISSLIISILFILINLEIIFHPFGEILKRPAN